MLSEKLAFSSSSRSQELPVYIISPLLDFPPVYSSRKQGLTWTGVCSPALSEGSVCPSWCPPSFTLVQ